MELTPQMIIQIALLTPGIKPGEYSLPILFWGNPGIGKTALIQRTALDLGFHALVLSPGEMGEGAFGVVPVPLSEGKGKPTRIVYPAPQWVDELPHERSLVFVDELSSAPPQLHPPLLGLLLEKRIGGQKLPSTVRMLAAANPPEIAANGFDLPPPLANRMGHADWHAQSVDAFSDYVAQKDWTKSYAPTVDDMNRRGAQSEKAVLDAWPLAYARVAGLVSAFLRAKPGLKNQMPAAGSTTRAFPTDRSWDMAVHAMAGSIACGFEPLMVDMGGLFVGQGVAAELAQFAVQQDLPNPADVLDGKVKFTHNPSRLDRTFAVLESCHTLVSQQNCERRELRAKALWKLIDSVVGTSADLCIRAGRALVKENFVDYEVSKKIAPIIQQAK